MQVNTRCVDLHTEFDIREVLEEFEIIIPFFFFQVAEYRVSIYGRKQSEWDQLASWFINNSIYSENAVWLIQVCINN